MSWFTLDRTSTMLQAGKHPWQPVIFQHVSAAMSPGCRSLPRRNGIRRLTLECPGRASRSGRPVKFFA